MSSNCKVCAVLSEDLDENNKYLKALKSELNEYKLQNKSLLNKLMNISNENNKNKNELNQCKIENKSLSNKLMNITNENNKIKNELNQCKIDNNLVIKLKLNSSETKLSDLKKSWKISILNEIFDEIKIVLKTYFDSYGCEILYLIYKSDDKNHLFNIKDNEQKQNIGEIDFNKFKNFNEIKENKKEKLKEVVSIYNKCNMSARTYRELSVNNPTHFSYENLIKLKEEINLELPIKSFINNTNEISLSYLKFEFVLEKSIKMLFKKEKKFI